MRTIKLTIAYDGTAYVGWQRQANGTSIQEMIEEAFVPLVGARPTVAGAGRTDAGVHALAQVASVNVETAIAAPAIQRALNFRLPADIRIVEAVDAPLGFHAQFHARGKAYRYRFAVAPVLSPFDRWFVWHVPQPLDVPAMREAAARLAGRHDFAAFQAAGSAVVTTVRTLDRVEVVDAGDELHLEVAGDGFLRHMIRIVAGTLVEVGGGQRTAASVGAMLGGKPRRDAGQTAPASGLTLVGVRY